MHKKHTKPRYKDHRQSATSRRGHVKNKETDDSTLEFIKAPQNSRNEISTKLGFGDYEAKDKFKSKKGKHKHKKDEAKSSDHQGKRQEKKSLHDFATIQDSVFDKEPVKRKEKKEKRDKERLNKIEKYLESLNQVSSKTLVHNRSLSEGSKALLINREKYLRREKTFHYNTSRDVSTNSRFGPLDAKDQSPPPTKGKSPKHKKHKHRENKKREYSEEKDTKVNQQSVMYCEVELQSPFLQDKNQCNIEQFSETAKEKSSRKRSSSRDQSAPPLLTSQRDKINQLKDKKMVPIKLSPQKSKLRTDLRTLKDQRSNASLGPYSKYFVFDKIPQNEQETSPQKKKNRRKEGGTTKKSRNKKGGEAKEDNIKLDKTRKHHQENGSSHSDQYKAKIEDDIKSYFSKIQTLIDKKLDFILGNKNNTKESKSNSLENEHEAEKTKSKKEKKSKHKAEQQTRDRSHSKKRKHDRHGNVEDGPENSFEEESKIKHSGDEKRGIRERHGNVEDGPENSFEEESKIKHSGDEKRDIRETKRLKDVQESNVSLRRERYPSVNSRNHKRRQSPQQQRPCHDHRSASPRVGKRKSDKEVRQHKRHKSPYGGYSAHKMSPDRLIKMLEHPSTFSVQSTTSLFKARVINEMKRRPDDTQTNPKETEYYRDRSLSKRHKVHDENNSKVEISEKPHPQEAYSKKLHKQQLMEPPRIQSKTLVKEIFTVEPRCKSDINGSEHHEHKRGRSIVRRGAIPGEDGFEEIEPEYQRRINKKLKKRMRQLMNLECKTVSIVRIPSQIRESAIFNETQTTTSLNIINPKEDIVEQKKKSKRFKLYYKYSVADNKCSPDSDKSSEGKKSIVSDSYRVVSDPSDYNVEVWEDKDDLSRNMKKESNPELAKILFIMKKEKAHKNVSEVRKKHRKRGDSPKPITLNNIVEEPSNISIMIHANNTSDSPLLLRKDVNCTFFNTLKSSSSDCNLMLVRKSSRKDKCESKKRHLVKPLKENTARPKSSSRNGQERDHHRDVESDKKSNCEEKRGHTMKMMKIDSIHKIKKRNNKHMYKYTSKSDINISYDSLNKYEFKKRKPKADDPSHFKEQIRQLLPEIFFRKSSPDRKSIDLIIQEEIREIIRDIPRNVIREISKESKQTDVSINTSRSNEEAINTPDINSKELSKISKVREVEESTYCFEKTSDLNKIDSTVSKENNKIEIVEKGRNYLREVTESNEIDSKESNKNLKEENVEQETNHLNGIEEPNEMDSKQSNENPENQHIEKEVDCSKEIMDSHEINLKHSNESPKIQDLDEKTYSSKKIGTHNAMTKIPSLIKGYTGPVPSQIIKDECMEIRNSTLQVNQHEISEDAEKDLGEKILVDATTEVNITEETLDKAMIMLENKKSQTPSYLDTPTVVAICDPIKQYKYPKKLVTANIKHCQIIDPFSDAKMGSVCKSTRPIINLENNQFPNRKLPEEKSVTPPSEQCKRQKSILSDEERRTVKFENQETSRPKSFLEKRPATADEKRKELPSYPLDKFRHKRAKPALTISTNVFTIDASKCTETSYNTQTKPSRRNINKYTEQDRDERLSNKRDATFRKNKAQDDLISKSSKSLNDVDVESNIGSLVCVERYSNIQKMNLNSNSNSRSLDRYTTKSLLNDNPHSSRLFLTKNFDPKMNTYQRRKMYDDSIRKKMKKKHGTQNEMGPRIFEVRYLTLENTTLNENTDITPVVNQKCISRFPTYNTKTNKAKMRTKPSTKKSRRYFPKNKEDACKFSGRDIFAPLISDVDQLNKFRRKAFPEKKVEEIFVKGGSLKPDKNSSDTEQSSSIALKKEVINSDQPCKTDKINSVHANQNFKELIDCLYNSIISYCDTKFNQSPQDSSHIVKGEESLSRSPPVNEKSYVIFPKPSNESISTTNAPFKKNSSSEGNVTSDDKEFKPPTNLICSHLSCPVLAGSSSSFDYLYEDVPVELDKDALLLHFKKPIKTILGYALNNTTRIEKHAFTNFPKKENQTSKSMSESEESGYSSSKSKKCASVCSFFKKPSIINLFKPENRLETSLQSTSSLNDSRSGPNFQEYNVMNQKCIEYAEKVRNQTQNKDESEETFREIPLDVLLLCRKSSALSSNFNSNCSLCKKRSNPDLPDITEADELTFHAANMENADHLLEDKNSLRNKNLIEEDNNSRIGSGDIREESVIFYQDLDCRSSSEVITVQKSQTSIIADDSQLIQEMVQCPVVLSITNLNSYSLTVVEDTDSNNFCCDQKKSVQMISSNHTINLKQDCHISPSSIQSDFDCTSDVSSNIGSRYTSSGMASKFMAKRFFDNLLKVYEKEIDVTNKLFQNDSFFLNVLLESIKLGEVRRPKNFNLKTMFKGKIKNYIGNIFSPKKCVSKINECVDPLEKGNPYNNHQRKLQILASDARKYFSMFAQAVKTNKDITDEIKVCGLLRLLERIEDGDFAILRKKEEVDFEEEIKEQVKEAFVNIYHMSVKEARKRKRSLTTDDLRLIRTFVSKYRIGLLSKTDLIATYIGRGAFKTENHLKAAVTYLIQENKANNIDLKDFDEHCKILSKCSVK